MKDSSPDGSRPFCHPVHRRPFGDNVFKNAFVLLSTFGLAVEHHWNPAYAVYLIGGLFILPFVLISGWAGYVSDIWPRHTLVRALKTFEAFVMFGAAVALYTDSFYGMWVIIVALGFISALFGPLKYGLLPVYLKDDELVGGNAFGLRRVLWWRLSRARWSERGRLVSATGRTEVGEWLAGPRSHRVPHDLFSAGGSGFGRRHPVSVGSALALALHGRCHQDHPHDSGAVAERSRHLLVLVLGRRAALVPSDLCERCPASRRRRGHAILAELRPRRWSRFFSRTFP